MVVVWSLGLFGFCVLFAARLHHQYFKDGTCITYEYKYVSI